MDSCTAMVSPEEFQLGQAPEDVQTAWISSLSSNPEEIKTFEPSSQPGSEILSKLQIGENQKKDPVLGKLISLIKKVISQSLEKSRIRVCVPGSGNGISFAWIRMESLEGDLRSQVGQRLYN